MWVAVILTFFLILAKPHSVKEWALTEVDETVIKHDTNVFFSF